LLIKKFKENISEYVRSVKRKLRMMQNKHLAEPVDYDLHDDEVLNYFRNF